MGPQTGDFETGSYVTSRAVEFRYEGDSRQRYLMREIDPAQLPTIVPLATPRPLWTEYDPAGSPLLDLEADVLAEELNPVRSYEVFGSSETPIDPQTGIPGISMVRATPISSAPRWPPAPTTGRGGWHQPGVPLIPARRDQCSPEPIRGIYHPCAHQTRRCAQKSQILDPFVTAAP